MEKVELRKRDFITSIILVAFGIWMLVYTVTTVPMKDSFGGVMNVWYVSPGLFPICIGILIVTMGTVLGINAIREGGAKRFFEDLFNRKKESTGKTLRLMGILLVIGAYVYLNIPRIDFFLSTMFCLLVFISLFYFDDPELLRKLFSFYLIGSLLCLVLFIAGVDKRINEKFPYAMDALIFLFFLSYIFYSRLLIRKDEGLRKKFKTTLIMSVVVPLALVPSFKYLLLVPLPVEGGFIELMNIVRYAFR